MSIVLRAGTLTDAKVCGSICFEAFKAIDDEHNFPWDFPSADVATGLLTMMLSNPGFYSVGHWAKNLQGTRYARPARPMWPLAMRCV
jgi:hypothetical protein